jgi:hypothetical protein
VILAAAYPVRVGVPVDLLGAYAEHVATLTISKAGRADRLRAAQRFLAGHPDLVAWMGRPTPQRLVDLHRAKAWPLLSWCFIEGHLRPAGRRDRTGRPAQRSGRRNRTPIHHLTLAAVVRVGFRTKSEANRWLTQPLGRGRQGRLRCPDPRADRRVPARVAGRNPLQPQQPSLTRRHPL